MSPMKNEKHDLQQAVKDAAHHDHDHAHHHDHDHAHHHDHDHLVGEQPRVAESKAYWRSIEDQQGTPTFSVDQDYEYTPTAEEIEAYTTLSRRKFLGLASASAAAAALASTGCIRKPVERILPYAKRPEEIIPGKPIFFATAMNLGNAVQGLLVESQEGRPTKVEGNPEHPMSFGSTNVWAQSSVLDLYDPDRSQYPQNKQKRATWDEFFKAFRAQLETLGKDGGRGLALLMETTPSPTFHDLLATVKKRLPQARLFSYDTMQDAQGVAARSSLGAQDLRPLYNLHKAETIVSLEHDFLGGEGDDVRQARLFASRRKPEKGQMNRLYVVEGNFTTTGAAADHRLRLQSSQVGEFLAALVARLVETKQIQADSLGKALSDQLSQRAVKASKALGKKFSDWAVAVAEELAANKGRSLVMVGESQPAHVQALGYLVNQALGNIGEEKPLVLYSQGNEVATESLAELNKAVGLGAVQTLVILGGNPVYTAPADIDFAKLLQQVPFSVHHGMNQDETAQAVTWHIPQTHYLEAWGDLRATNGVTSIVQPLIAPLYDAISSLELLSYVAGESAHKGHVLVQSYWKKKLGGDFEKQWRRALHDGVIAGTREKAAAPTFKADGLASSWGVTPAPQSLQSFEIRFVLDQKVHDGRFINNGWLQELPDPMTKLTWDNAALLGTATASSLKVGNGDWIEITLQGRKIELPVYIAPGVADQTIVLPLGYGQAQAGRIGQGTGFNVYPLRSSSTLHHAKGASVKKLAKAKFPLATTQEHGRLEDPILNHSRKDAIFREFPLAAYTQVSKEAPDFMEEYEVMPAKKIKSLWKEPNETGGHQWAMTIDLTTCTGCNACAVACQAENNIAIVGKERVLMGREMSWIRLDRYYTGDTNDPEAALQPVACVHCENAPCENVCPVAATAHSPDGMNDMAYNRCIGTRYCANNCPYKVRRFNFFNFSREADERSPSLQMQRNPDVTVRFRGVMEKCTYCVQRVQEAKIYAKAHGDGQVADAYALAKTNEEGIEILPFSDKNTVVPACAQACSSQAIVFGNLNDPKSRVNETKKVTRNYAVLRELNIKPRTTYLAQVRNRNEKLFKGEYPKLAKALKDAKKPKKAAKDAKAGH
jgi:molybdopterin-containing oxidoreductase family iron-sulfur binding subunit